MITLTLLHPLQAVPVQSWTFRTESKIRIGRSTTNEVVLYSAVVSRHHVELRKTGNDWEVVNLGANGTYIEGQRVNQTVVSNGTIIRLASSGPKIAIEIESEKGEKNSSEGSESEVSSKPIEKPHKPRISKDTLIS